MSDVIVCYGRENEGQPYGGGIVYGNRYLDKPCFLDIMVYEDVVGVVYIAFSGSVVKYFRASGSIVVRVIIYGR